MIKVPDSTRSGAQVGQGARAYGLIGEPPTGIFAFENLKPTDGLIVGMFPWCFDEVSANAQYTRELGEVAKSRAAA